LEMNRFYFLREKGMPGTMGIPYGLSPE